MRTDIAREAVGGKQKKGESEIERETWTNRRTDERRIMGTAVAIKLFGLRDDVYGREGERGGGGHLTWQRSRVLLLISIHCRRRHAPATDVGPPCSG